MIECPACGPVQPAANPRMERVCPRCGRDAVLTPRVTEVHRQGEPFFDRHLKPGTQIHPAYAAMVLERYHQASREYGQSWRHKPLAAFADEAAEEGLDVGGWLMLLAERLDELPPEARLEAQELVAVLIADGARVAARARRLSALIRHAGDLT